uniref:Uncharacterized protein n=1 Tax=Arion vulgaris TaxID=1028688 RepID=A0A0B7B3N1_9EUPU
MCGFYIEVVSNTSLSPKVHLNSLLPVHFLFKEFGITSRARCLHGRERNVFNQQATGTITIHILRLLLGVTEHLGLSAQGAVTSVQ